MRSAPWYAALFLSGLAGVLLSLLIGEVGVRLFAPQAVYTKMPLPCYDSGTGLQQEERFFRRTKEFTEDAQINSLGLHDEEHTLVPAPGTYRIMVLGDSFAEAIQVPLRKCWFKIMERRLFEQTGRDVEVINMGQGGAGTGWEVYLYEKTGRHYSPDLVLVGFHLGSDFYNNHPRLEDKYQKPFFKIAGGRVVLLGPEGVESIVRGICFPLWKRSHLYRFVHRKLQVIRKAGQVDGDGIPREVSQFLVPADPVWDEAEDMTGEYLAQLQKLVDEDDARLVVAGIPDRIQIYAEDRADCEQRWPAIARRQWRPDMPALRLKRLTDRLGIRHIDMLAPLREASAREGRMYFREDIHWNSEGNAVAGRVLADALAPLLQGQGR